MPVTDDEVAVLRAYLRGEQALQQELYGRMTTPTARARYSALIAAAFFEAVDRRFGGRDSAAEVIEYVADVRARVSEVGQEIDPSPSERLISRVLTGADTSDISGRDKGKIFIVFLMALVSDAQYDDVQLEAFLAEARKIADDGLEH